MRIFDSGSTIGEDNKAHLVRLLEKSTRKTSSKRANLFEAGNVLMTRDSGGGHLNIYRTVMDYN
jgi:hypothetical protein